MQRTLRLIGENKLLSVISILGTALAICMIMVIMILYFVNTTGFKPEVNRDRTYYFSTVLSSTKSDNRRMSFSSAGLPFIKDCYYPLKSAEVVTAVNQDMYSTYSVSSMDGLRNRSGYVISTDPAFWQLFKFDFLEGEAFSEAAFESGIRDAVISESVARDIFGTENAVGKEMKLDYQVYAVRGVVKDVSRFATKAWADIWIPYRAEENQGWQEGVNGNLSCYVLLKNGYTREDLRKEALERVKAFNAKTSDINADIRYQPFSQIQEWIAGGNEGEVNPAKMFIQYGIIIFILLLVPALNLSGITLSRLRKRMPELGVRRAFGATQGVILWQVLMENMVLTLLGGILGLAMSYGAMLLLRNWLLVSSIGKSGLSIGMFNGYVFVTAFLFCLVLNLLSAGVPAWKASKNNITDSINE